MENILFEIGECGRFQIFHVTLVQFCRFVVNWAFTLMIFGLYNPGWRCIQNDTRFAVVPFLNRNNSKTLLLTTDDSLQSTNTTKKFSQQLYNRIMNPSNEMQRSRYKHEMNSSFDLHKVLNDSSNSIYDLHRLRDDSYNCTCDIISSCFAIEFNPATSTIVTEFGLICDKVWISHLIVSVLQSGKLIGGVVFGQIGERFGRKVGLYGCLLTITLACGLAVFSPVWELYAFFMFFIGVGATAIPPITAVLCMEFLNHRWRANISSIPAWSAGCLSFAIAVYILRDWKHVHLAGAFIFGISLLGIIWTPESLRWLVLHGKTTQAQKAVKKAARLNRKPFPSEILKKLVGTKHNHETDKHYNYFDLFKNPEIRNLLFKLTLIRTVSMLVNDMITFGIKSLPGDFYNNLILVSIITLPCIVVSGPLANRIGRRLTGILFIAVGTFSSTTIVMSLLAIEPGNLRDILVTSMALVNISAVQGLLTLMTTYTVELMPTAVRNLAFGVIFTVQRFVSIAGPFLLPEDHTSMIACFSVLILLQIIATVAIFKLAETKDRALEDMYIVPISGGNKSEEGSC